MFFLKVPLPVVYFYPAELKQDQESEIPGSLWDLKVL